jgi:MSHA biogenesis protein MshQ
VTYATLADKAVGQSFNLDLVALLSGGTLNSSFNGTAQIDLVANTSAGVALGAKNCPVSQTATIALGNPTFASGRVSAAVASQSTPYADVRVKFTCSATQCGTATTECSTDNFAIAISGPDHVEFVHDGSAVTCAAEPITVLGCTTSATCYSVPGNQYSGTLSVTLPAITGATWCSDSACATTISGAQSIAAGSTIYLKNTTVSTSSLAGGTVSGATNGTVQCYNSATATLGTSTAACNLAYADAGFIFTTAADGTTQTIATQTAGTASAVHYLRAVKTSTTTKACEGALLGANSVNLGYTCSNPSSCTAGNYMNITPYNGATAQATVGVPAAAGSVTLYFDANGNAPFAFAYLDVGTIALSASKAAGGSLQKALSGSSNAFVVKPYALVLSGIKCTTANAANCGAGALAMTTPGDNPGAANAAGDTFIRAGHPFTVTVTAQANGGSATPNFDKENVPEWVKLTPALVTGLGLTASSSVDRTISGSISSGSSTLTVTSSAGYAAGDRLRVAGAGAAGVDLVTTVASVPTATSLTLSVAASTTVAGAVVNYMFPAFSAGTATGSNFTWDEVGIITLTPAIGDGSYLGAGSVTGTTSGNVGRFYPHHFGVSGSVVNRSDVATPGGSFTYMDEPMKLTLPVTAYSKSESVTQNYAGSFAKLDATTLGTTAANWVCTSGAQCMGLGAVGGSTNLTSRLGIDTTATNSTAPTNTTTAGGATAGWSGGSSYFTLYAKFGRTTPPDGPYGTLKFGAKPLDSDGVTVPERLSVDTTHCVSLDITTGTENAACDPGTIETNLRRKLFETDVRYGRLRLMNAYGSELLPLAVPAAAQYYNGTNWVTNALDSSTPPVPWAVLPAVSTALLGGTGSTTPSLSAALVSGKASLAASAPGAGKYGYLDLTVTVPDYLKFPWTGAAATDPTARVTFGIYNQPGNSSKIIYRREVR